MPTLEAAQAFHPNLQRVLRLIPPGTKGKARLTRLLFPLERCGRAVSIKNNEGQLLLVPNLREPIGFHMWMDGVWERDTLAFLREMLSPGEVFFDVGANIGIFTLPMALRAGAKGCVVAIEASSAVGQVLECNVRANRLENVRVIRCAASDGASESVDFYDAPTNDFGMGSSAPQFGAKPASIPAMSLDRILEIEQVPPPAVIKADVEGYESQVFLGARRILTGPKPPRIIFEFCDWAEERAMPGKRGLAQRILMDLNYDIWTLEDFRAAKDPIGKPVMEGLRTMVAVRRS